MTTRGQEFIANLVLIWAPLCLAGGLLIWAAISARTIFQIILSGIAAAAIAFVVCILLAVTWFLGGLFAPGTGSSEPELWDRAKWIGIASLLALAAYFPIALTRWRAKKRARGAALKQMSPAQPPQLPDQTDPS